MKEKIKGIEGWLLFFVIILIIIQPGFLLFDVIINPSFYSYSSGIYDLFSLLLVFGLAIWSIAVGIAIWNKKRRAIIWAKEFLIVSLVISIVFTFLYFGLYTLEEQNILLVDLFRSLISFGIWFSYLNVSKRVKNTFKKTKIEWKRLGIVFLVMLGVLFLTGIVSSLVPQNIETAGLKIAGTPQEITQEYTLEAEMVQYHEFGEQNIITDSIISFESNLPTSVFLVKSEKDFNNFVDGFDYEIYDGCFVEEKYSGEIRCTISSGGVVVWNYNQEDIEYSLTFK
ncbi:DUF2569 domain-containing protein [Candidatus Woesearchaeota archaeon]|nr:DUF2569 domain-containing protein [Candidatus Woesearchaeota archaeon]